MDLQNYILPEVRNPMYQVDCNGLCAFCFVAHLNFGVKWMLGTLRYSCRLQATISFGGCEFLKSSILFWVRELDNLSRQDQPLEFSHTKTGAHSRRVYESGAMVSWSCYFRNSVIKLKWIDKRNFTFHFLFGWMESKAPQSLICMEQSVCWAHFREDLAPTINGLGHI